MEYNEIKQTVARAWGAFEYQLKVGGFTDDEVENFKLSLCYKDGYSKVEDAAMEATR